MAESERWKKTLLLTIPCRSHEFVQHRSYLGGHFDDFVVFLRFLNVAYHPKMQKKLMSQAISVDNFFDVSEFSSPDSWKWNRIGVGPRFKRDRTLRGTLVSEKVADLEQVLESCLEFALVQN